MSKANLQFLTDLKADFSQSQEGTAVGRLIVIDISLGRELRRLYEDISL